MYNFIFVKNDEKNERKSDIPRIYINQQINGNKRKGRELE